MDPVARRTCSKDGRVDPLVGGFIIVELRSGPGYDPSLSGRVRGMGLRGRSVEEGDIVDS